MARSSIRNSRETEVVKNETYSPPFSYDIPEEVKEDFNNKGYHLRWVRVIIDNNDDYKNVADRRREGYEPVAINELPENVRDLFETKSFGPNVGKYSNIAMVGDLALFKITLAKARARQRYFENIATNNEAAVMRQLSGDSRLNKLLPIQDESTTQVRVGSRATAPNEFGKTLKGTNKDSSEEEFDNE